MKWKKRQNRLKCAFYWADLCASQWSDLVRKDAYLTLWHSR